MSRATSRSCSNSGKFAAAAARRAMKDGPLRASAFCSPALSRARAAFCLKAEEVATCMANNYTESWGFGPGGWSRGCVKSRINLRARFRCLRLPDGQPGAPDHVDTADHVYHIDTHQGRDSR